MTKSIYSLFILCGAIYLVATAFQIGLQNHFDFLLYQLPSFLPWLAVAFGTSLMWLACLFAYHFLTGHTAASVFVTIHSVVVAARYYVVYSVFSDGSYTNLYFPSYFLALCTWILYGISLIYSAAGKLQWLKIAGVYLTTVTIILVLTLIMYLYAADPYLKATIENIHNTLSWFGELPTLLLIVNWWVVRKSHVGYNDHHTLPGMLQVTILLATVSCVILGIRTGNKLLREKPVYRLKEPVANSQDIAYAKRFEPRSYVNKQGDTLRYRLMKPMHYDPDKKYPLVLCLHGGAGWGTDNIKQVFGSLPAVMLSNYLVREKHPAFLVVPQITGAFSWGGIPHLQSADKLVLEMLQAVETEFSVDSSRRYIAGNSLGGYGTWYFIGKHPRLFAVAIPISGDADPGLARQMSGVAVWAFHGAKDINVPVNGSRRMILALRDVGSNPKYTEYPDAGHDIWKQVINTPDLIDWLFKQRKDLSLTKIPD